MKKIHVRTDRRTINTKVFDRKGKLIPRIKRLVIDFDVPKGIMETTMVQYVPKSKNGETKEVKVFLDGFTLVPLEE